MSRPNTSFHSDAPPCHQLVPREPHAPRCRHGPQVLHLLRLLDTEKDVTTLTAQVEASRPSVSQHLGRLRLAGLVQARRDGRRMLYRITSDHLAALVAEALGYAYHAVHDIPHHRRPPDEGAARR